MIDQFDSVMFQLHQDTDALSAAYAAEKEELAEAQGRLEEIEKEKAEIIEQQRLEEEREREEQLLNIRRNVAAKCIQRAWRSHRARMMLKSKKKRKKK